MKIHVHVEDAKLIHLLEQVHTLSVHHIQQPQAGGAEVLILSDRLVHHNELATYALDAYDYVFYLVSNTPDHQLVKQIKTICDSLAVYMIQPRMTVEQIVAHILYTLFPEGKEHSSNVVTLVSPIANIGLTSTALSLASSIAKLTNAKIGVLGLNAWDDGIDHISSYKGKYLNEIKTQLTNRVLDSHLFLQSCHYEGKRGFYYLAGNQNTKMERLFTIEEIDYLITIAKEQFDLVLIDAGCHWDNATIMQSLRHADLKLIVMNQQRKAIKKLEQVDQHILFPLGYQRSDFLMVLNQYTKSATLPEEKEIYLELSIPYLTAIPALPYLGLQAEIQQKILYEEKDEEYNHAIDHIARGIVARTDLILNLPPEGQRSKRWGFFSTGR